MSDETEQISKPKETDLEVMERKDPLRLFKRKSQGSFWFHEPIMRYYIIFMIVLAQYSPIDVLDQYPFLTQFTDVMSSIFANINACAAKSKFPQVTTLYMSISWLFSPLAGYFLWQEYKTDSSKEVVRIKTSPWNANQKTRGWLCVIVFTIMVIAYPFNPIGSDFHVLPYNSSRFVLGIAGHLIAGGVESYMAVYTYLIFLKLINSTK